MTEGTRAKFFRLLWPRLPQLLVLAPLWVAVVAGSAGLAREGELGAWHAVKEGFQNYQANYDEPDRDCTEQIQIRIDQLQTASIFALRRRVDGDIRPPGAETFLRTCVDEALQAAIDDGLRR